MSLVFFCPFILILLVISSVSWFKYIFIPILPVEEWKSWFIQMSNRHLRFHISKTDFSNFLPKPVPPFINHPYFFKAMPPSLLKPKNLELSLFLLPTSSPSINPVIPFYKYIPLLYCYHSSPSHIHLSLGITATASYLFSLLIPLTLYILFLTQQQERST